MRTEALGLYSPDEHGVESVPYSWRDNLPDVSIQVGNAIALTPATTGFEIGIVCGHSEACRT